MSRNLYLGLDLGTSSAKCIVVDEQGSLVSLGQALYSVKRRGGWAEQEPGEWWQAACESVRQALQGESSSSVRGLGVTGQMHGLVALNAKGSCLRPAIIWEDTRAEAQVSRLARHGAELYGRLGGPVSVGFLLPSLLWLKEHEPQVYGQIWQVCTPKDYLRFLLTQKMTMDPTDACGTGAFNVAAGRWDEDVLGFLGVDPGLFPPITPSLEVGGYLGQGPAQQLGLPSGIPIVTGCGDAQASAVGMGISKPHQLLVNMGTGAQVFQLLTEFKSDARGRFHTMLHADGRHWHTLGAILAGGLALEWAASAWNQSPAEFFAQGTPEPACASGLFFLPYLIGERTPYMDANLTGAFLGLRIRHTAQDLAQAVMEGVGFALYHAYEVTREAAGAVEVIRAGGGPLRNPELRQLLADIFGLPLEYSPEPNSSALGAAFLAISALTGSSLEEVSGRFHRSLEAVEPNLARHGRFQEGFEQFKELSGVWQKARDNEGC